MSSLPLQALVGAPLLSSQDYMYEPSLLLADFSPSGEGNCAESDPQVIQVNIKD